MYKYRFDCYLLPTLTDSDWIKPIKFSVTGEHEDRNMIVRLHNHLLRQYALSSSSIEEVNQ